ncbi:hypothetical protein [Oleiagrimonas sp. MCCC 1A03011]|uniref:hypothetical protein n=1 Tax=Oleiagrimonas sp. MCCC 1A03011 TaxID=1926883 RepID=UPI000DC5F7EA|nr:hypothetical protein [Oleiagrimonas sp. MCCC 1A03011]RAP56095.1 hypothetical protein BTJ49_14740 [Oleiagrimonas sp. MCCC 1A03011]
MRKITKIFAATSFIAASLAAAPTLLAATQNSNAKDTTTANQMMQGQVQKGSGTDMMDRGMGMMNNGNKMPMMQMMAEMNRMMKNCNQMMERMNTGHPKSKAEPGKG